MGTTENQSGEDVRGEDLIHDWNTVSGYQPPSTKIAFCDETLRDGLQSPSVTDPSIEKKVEMLHLMESLGIDAVTLGLPGAGPRAVADVTRLVKEISDNNMKIVPNCAARTHENDIMAVADIAQATGVAVGVNTFIGSSPIRQYTEDWTLEMMMKHTIGASKLAAKYELEHMMVTEDTQGKKVS